MSQVTAVRARSSTVPAVIDLREIAPALEVESDSNVGDEHEARRLDELVGGGRTVAMVMTMIDGAHTSRPVTCVEVGTGRMSFLVSREVEWVADIAAGRATVHVTVADQKDNTYVSLEGTAGVASDIAEMERLWTPVAKVWFDGPHDPSLAVLHFDVTTRCSAPADR